MNTKYTSETSAWTDVIRSLDRMKKSIAQLNQLYAAERRYAGDGEARFQAMLKDIQCDPASAFLQDKDLTP